MWQQHRRAEMRIMVVGGDCESEMAEHTESKLTDDGPRILTPSRMARIVRRQLSASGSWLRQLQRPLSTKATLPQVASKKQIKSEEYFILVANSFWMFRICT